MDVFRCPESGAALILDGDALRAASGRRWPIVRGVPRFVPDEAYAGSFGFEWTVHDRTQLDCHTAGTSSEAMLREKTGLDPEQVRGKLVLDAGVGAGRFSDVLSRWGARVVGIDLSRAVESAARNFADRPHVRIAQADIGRPPFAPETFDLVVSIGVLHHTPDTRAYLERLIPLLRPGGELCVWVYPPEGDYLVRSVWSPLVSRLPARWFYDWCKHVVPRLPADEGHPVNQLGKRLFPVSRQGLGVENDVLDTFDAYSPRYHWVHDAAEVAGWFRAAGLVDVRALGWPTSVRGRRPQS